MNYLESKEYIIKVFKEYNYKQFLREPFKFSEIVKKIGENTEVIISFPGYKAGIKETGEIIYDYRVDFRKGSCLTTLSHSNIVVDIYNKCLNNGIEVKAMIKYLEDIAIYGDEGLDKNKELLKYSPQNKPSNEIIKIAKEAHKEYEKNFKVEGNNFDLDFIELTYLIKWITLQEDLNYPISEGYQGRKMSFYRYIEAIYCINNSEHSLKDVFKRVIRHHSRPKLWDNIDYSRISNINE